jgi:hypothetical protein
MPLLDLQRLKVLERSGPPDKSRASKSCNFTSNVSLTLCFACT